MNSNKIDLLDKLLTLVSQYHFQEGEIIREITNYNSHGRYFISNYGNVFSLCLNYWHQKKPEKDKDGYYYVFIWYKGQRKRRYIHQLVAEYFVYNPAPNEKTIVHHIDYDIHNNHASNLMYVSPKEHSQIHSKHNKEVAEMRLKNDGREDS